MQAQAFPPPGIPPEVFWTIVAVSIAIGLAIWSLIAFFFLYTLNRALKRVAEPNREISPGRVWAWIVINLIPIVGSVWMLYIVTRLARSIRKEFEHRGWPTKNEWFGRIPGLLYGWGQLVALPVSVVEIYFQFSGDLSTAMLISLFSLPVSLAVTGGFIVYWVLMFLYGSRLKDGRREHNVGSVEEDFDERLDRFDRPRRRPNDRDD